MEQETQEKNQISKPDRGIKSGLIYVFLSIFLLISSVLLIIFFIYTFFVPDNSLNPFPPDSVVTLSSAVDPTPTSTPTNTPAPPTATPKPFPDVVPTLEKGVLFEVQNGTPIYTPHQSGCQFMYVGGSILDLDGNSLSGISVRLSGVIDGYPELTLEAVSGSALQYSSGGFEIQIGDFGPIATQNGVYLQLFLEDGSSASPMISFSTSGDCSRNLININFLQVRN
jgi:hypothetical protein